MKKPELTEANTIYLTRRLTKMIEDLEISPETKIEILRNLSLLKIEIKNKNEKTFFQYFTNYFSSKKD